MRRASYWAYWMVVVLVAGVSGYAQETVGTSTPLSALLAEAQAKNPDIAAAEHATRAAAQVARQKATLPDPMVTVQSFSVGSPKPFAGFSNSNFAYLGFGASQEIPYAGKLRLRGEVADRAAGTEQARAELLRTSIAEQVKLAYLKLAYLQATLTILEREDGLLRPLIETGLSRYSVGEGSQAEVLKAQMEHTKFVREVTMHHEEMGQLQAELKELLHRPQESADITPVELTATPLDRTAEELRAMVAGSNPAVGVENAALQQQDAARRSAEREGRPDFNVGYMFQQTGAAYSDYYMLTLSMRVPRRRRVEAGVAETTEHWESAKQTLDSEVQGQVAEVQKEYVAATSTAELLKEYREGLVPQAQAAFGAEQTTYASGKGTFDRVLASLLDVLTFEKDYQQTLLDHETALAHLETLTGAQLR